MHLMILAYNVVLLAALCLLTPIWLTLLTRREKYRRTFRKRAYMESIGRASRSTDVDAAPARIWIHALSVGEVLSAEPLVKALANDYGREKLVFTASTYTGYQMAMRVIAPHVSALRHFPYDNMVSVSRALAVLQPGQVIIVETDIWPTFLHCLHQRRIPVYLVNARLSDRSFRGYNRFGFLMAPVLSLFARICVQTQADQLRFRRLGVSCGNLTVTGNIKFDQAPVRLSTDDRSRLVKQFNITSNVPIWVAGSTHDGEEELVATAYRQICANGIGCMLLVAPRDPNRADAVCSVFRRSGIDAMTMAQVQGQSRQPEVVVIDRIGLLRQLYALGDVAFVGGSLVKAGGHNPLEPASVGKPVLFGPYTDDFRWICRMLESRGGALRISSTDELADQIYGLIRDDDRRKAVGRCAYTVFRSNRGAVGRTLTAVADTEIGRK
jgi:3-deoxy-D-manno-octulosonic-acid transferase